RQGAGQDHVRGQDRQRRIRGLDGFRHPESGRGSRAVHAHHVPLVVAVPGKAKRNWGTIITGFYILVVAALTLAAGLIALGNANPVFLFHGSRAEWIGFAVWVGWTLLLAGGPLVLLFVGVDASRVKLRPRRHILVSAVAAGLALSLLLFA